MSLLPEPLRIAAFRYFWLARLASTIGQMAMVIVIGWQVYDIARETMGLKEAALRLGIIGLVQFIRLFLLTLVTGWTADRVDRRWIARASVALEFGCAVALACSPGRTARRSRALRGGGSARRRPRLRRTRARRPCPEPRSARRSCRERSLCPRSPGRPARSSARRSAAISTPPRPSRPMRRAPDCSQSRSSACSRSGRCSAARSRSGVNPWAQMVEGLRYVRRNRLVLGAISLDLFAVLLGGATAMLPVFARDVLHAGPEGLGHLRAAPAVGATLTAAFFSIRPLKHNVGAENARRRRRVRRGNDHLWNFALDAVVARLPRAFWARPTCSRSMSASR